jgi:hypothetical protein
MSLTDESHPLSRTHPTGERRAELERIKAAMWPPNEPQAERQARIAKALAALDALKELRPFNLTPEQWAEIDRSSVLVEDEV